MTIRTLTYEGLTLSIREWTERTGLTEETIRARLRAGWTTERVLKPTLDRRGRKRTPKPTLLGKELPAWNRYQHSVHTAHRQLTQSIRLFLRDIEQQMAELRHQVDADLAAQHERATRAVLASHAPGVVTDLAQRPNDRSPPVAQDGV